MILGLRETAGTSLTNFNRWSLHDVAARLAFYTESVPHLIEPASSGRAKCRGCEQKIAKDERRFGERQPNAFGDGEMTLWFHPRCAAYKRPEPFLEAVTALPAHDFDELAAAARFGIEHRRVPRINGAERAPTGRARCRHCRELIAKDHWRIALVFFQDFRFDPGGFVHAACARGYFETVDVLARLRHFSPALSPEHLDDLEAVLNRS